MRTGPRVKMAQALYRSIPSKPNDDPPECELCGAPEEEKATFKTVDGFLVCVDCSTSPKLPVMRKESDERSR